MQDARYKMQDARIHEVDVEAWRFKRIRIWKFLTIALASCDETKEHLIILSETGALKDNDIFNSFMRRYEELGRKIHNLIKAVESGHRS